MSNGAADSKISPMPTLGTQDEINMFTFDEACTPDESRQFSNGNEHARSTLVLRTTDNLKESSEKYDVSL